MNVRVFYVVVLLLVHLFAGSISCAMLKGPYNDAEINKIISYTKTIHSMKDELYLEHKNLGDLYETISIANEQFKGSVFTLPEVTAIMMKESRFNQYATNKADGGKGLGQISHIGKYYRDELSFLTDPYDKKQNIKAMYIILNDKYKRWKNKHIAIMRYNGSGERAKKYLKDFIIIEAKLRKASHY